MRESIEIGAIRGAKIGLIPAGVCACITLYAFALAAPEVAAMYAMGTILWGVGGPAIGVTAGGALGGAAEATKRTANAMYSFFNTVPLLEAPQQGQPVDQPGQELHRL